MHSTNLASSNHLKTHNSRQNLSRIIRCLVPDLSRAISCSIIRSKYLMKKYGVEILPYPSCDKKRLKWTAAKVKASCLCFCIYQQVKLKKIMHCVQKSVRWACVLSTSLTRNIDWFVVVMEIILSVELDLAPYKRM